jgi:hypothetical protein
MWVLNMIIAFIQWLMEKLGIIGGLGLFIGVIVGLIVSAAGAGVVGSILAIIGIILAVCGRTLDWP